MVRQLVWVPLVGGCSLYFSDPESEPVAPPDTDALAIPCIRTLAAGVFDLDRPGTVLMSHACEGGPIVEYANDDGGLVTANARADWGYRFHRMVVADLDATPPLDVMGLAESVFTGWAFLHRAFSGGGQSFTVERPVEDLAFGSLDGEATLDIVTVGDGAIRATIDRRVLPHDIAAADERLLLDGKPFRRVAIAELGGSRALDLLYAADATDGIELGVAIQAAPEVFDITDTHLLPPGTMLPLARGDLDGDGIADVVGAASQVFVRSSKHGTFAILDEGANAIAAGDLDGDGVDEIVFVTADGSSTRIARLDESGALASELLDDRGGDLLALADLDGDGRDDVVLVQRATRPESRLVLRRAATLLP